MSSIFFNLFQNFCRYLQNSFTGLWLHILFWTFCFLGGKMEYIADLIKRSIPGISVLAILFLFYITLNEQHRFESFIRLIDLIFGNWFLLLVVVLELFFIWHFKRRLDEAIIGSDKITSFLSEENGKLKEDYEKLRDRLDQKNPPKKKGGR